MKCTKAHGLGNDYLFADAAEPGVSRDAGWITRVCDRRYGIGADGVILLRRRPDGAVDMLMHNADGSVGLLCGNGLRAAALVAKRWGWTPGETQVFHTGAGPREAQLLGVDRAASQATVRVDMGLPSVGEGALGFAGQPRMEGPAAGLEWLPVSMGNPHLVTFLKAHPDTQPWRSWGPPASGTSSVKGGVNAGFAFVESPHIIHLRVWERGSGPTLACGSGACAAFAAARHKGLASPQAELHLDGGILTLEEGTDGRLWMTGPAQIAFEGLINPA
ncbi:MAG: diaminopimelate epimerase [Planctomycetota bacterium]